VTKMVKRCLGMTARASNETAFEVFRKYLLREETTPVVLGCPTSATTESHFSISMEGTTGWTENAVFPASHVNPGQGLERLGRWRWLLLLMLLLLLLLLLLLFLLRYLFRPPHRQLPKGWTKGLGKRGGSSKRLLFAHPWFSVRRASLTRGDAIREA